MIEELLKHAVRNGGSDIHFVPGRCPMIRVHGDLRPVDDRPVLTPENTAQFAQILAGPELWTRFCETREMDFSIARTGLARFRVNLSWQRGTVAIALRAIPHQVPGFDELGLPKTLESFASRDHGLFIVTGPTGSGKSTTLAAMIDHINSNRSCHIVSIEDPIEYLHCHKKALVNQREMHQDTLSFPEALRRVLRQDPNVILIGEMRDLETVQTALTLAETGHLVLTTLHTADATQALTRIVDVFPAHQQTQARTQLSLGLIGIMAQHLMPRADGKGRVPACEILIATPAVANLIRSGEFQQVYTAIQTGAAAGMCSLNASLARLVKTGVVSREDAMRKATHAKDFLSQLAAAQA